MASVYDQIEALTSEINELVLSLPRVGAKDVGLDWRCPSLYIDVINKCVYVDQDRAGTLNYYGGFEYIDKDYQRSCGGFIRYTEDTRVDRVIFKFIDNWCGKHTEPVELDNIIELFAELGVELYMEIEACVEEFEGLEEDYNSKLVEAVQQVLDKQNMPLQLQLVSDSSVMISVNDAPV